LTILLIYLIGNWSIQRNRRKATNWNKWIEIIFEKSSKFLFIIISNRTYTYYKQSIFPFIILFL